MQWRFLYMFGGVPNIGLHDHFVITFLSISFSLEKESNKKKFNLILIGQVDYCRLIKSIFFNSINN